MTGDENSSSSSSWNDSEFESRYNKINGSSSESSYQFIRRSYQGLCDRICQPERRIYTPEDVQMRTDTVMRNYFKSTNIDSLSSDESFEIHEEYISIPDFSTNTIKFALWENKKMTQRKRIFEEETNNPTFQMDTEETSRNTSGSIHSSISNSETTSNSTCVLYLHTHTRNLLEATEVLSICYELNMHAVSFDLPGHGHTHSSDEVMSAALSLAMMDTLIGYIKKYYHIDHVVLWARGMSTALAIEYCGSLIEDSDNNTNNDLPSGMHRSDSYVAAISDKFQSMFFSSPQTACIDTTKRQLHPSHSCSDIYSSLPSSSSPPNYFDRRSQFASNISTSNMSRMTSALSVSSELSSYSPTQAKPLTAFKYPNVQFIQLLILDTPFTSIQGIVDDAVKTMQHNGYHIPKLVFDFGVSMIKSSVTQRLGFDPYTIKPITFVGNINKPVAILVASRDDYIHPQRCLEIQAKLQSRDSRNHQHRDKVDDDSSHSQQWQCCCELIHFDGSHYSERPVATLHSPLKSFIQQHCNCTADNNYKYATMFTTNH